MVWGTIIGATIGAAGSLLGAKKQDQAARYATDQNTEIQRELAQKGIQYRVDDAKKAGIHPLAALGANISPAAPVAVGGGNVGRAISDASQNIGRAIGQTLTAREKAAATREMTKQALEKGSLENEYLRAQIRNLNRPGLPNFPDASPGNGMEIPGQGNGASVQTVPSTPTAWEKGKPAQEAGSHTDYAFSRGPNGQRYVVPSKDVKERIEDVWPAELAWGLRNYVRRGKGSKPPASALPSKKHEWKWSWLEMGYVPVLKKKWSWKQLNYVNK